MSSTLTIFLTAIVAFAIGVFVGRWTSRRKPEVADSALADVNMAAIHDKRNGVMPVKRDLKDDPDGLVEGFGVPDYTKRESQRLRVEQAEQPRKEPVWDTYLSPRRERGYMQEPRRGNELAIHDSMPGIVPVGVTMLASGIALIEPVEQLVEQERRPVSDAANSHTATKPVATDDDSPAASYVASDAGDGGD